MNRRLNFFRPRIVPAAVLASSRRSAPALVAATTSLLALGGLLVAGGTPAHAYEEDTHYTMTLVLCQAAGMSYSDAVIVANYDQGMDDSPGTVAVGGTGGIIPNLDEEHLWHSIPQNGTADEVLKRKQELWNKIGADSDPTNRLKRLGVFFHYQQDTWAHRKHENSSATSFTPYSVPFGHAADGHQPDRPPFDPVCALRCLEDGIGYARQFITQYQGRTPSALFNNYSAASGNIDDNWNDSRKGKYFHELTLDPSTPARKLLTDLVRSQIDAYKTSMDFNPNYTGRYTADEANYSAVRGKLKEACARANVAVEIPASRDKITTLTSSQLGGTSLGPRDYQVVIYTGDKSGAGTDSNIFLSITGTNGSIGEQRLNGLISGNAFEKNQTDRLTLKGLQNIGELVSITVRSDDKYLASGWYLGWIEISAPNMATRRFTLNDWIEKGKLTRTITP